MVTYDKTAADTPCDCGNDTSQEGFFPCDRDGNEVEPLLGVWTEPLYVCARCRKIRKIIMEVLP